MIIKNPAKSDINAQFGTLNLDQVEISPRESVRDIGVVFDQNLSSESHINNIVRQCNCNIRNIYSIRKNLDIDSTKSLVNAMVSSRVDYCCSLFLSLPNKQLKKLQVILNEAARMIFKLGPRESATPLQITLHWLPIKARIEFKICLITYKVLKFKEPSYLYNLLSFYSNESSMELRLSNDTFRLNEPRAVGEKHLFSRSYSYAAPRFYNKLPLALKSIDSTDTFKSQLKTHIFSKAYTPSGEISPEYQVQMTRWHFFVLLSFYLLIVDVFGCFYYCYFQLQSILDYPDISFTTNILLPMLFFQNCFINECF